MTSPLFTHQAEAIAIANRQANLALFHDPGLGKTRTVLEIYKMYKQRVPDLKLLVVCPLSIIDDAWMKNAKQFVPELTICNMRKAKNPERFDILVINYEMLISAKKLAIITALVQAHPFAITLDESSRLKNPNAKTTKVLLSLRDDFLARLLMSGTPAPNGEHEYWGQMCFLEDGVIPGDFQEFRNRFFYLSRGSGESEQKSSVGHRPGLMMQEGWKIKITNEKREKLASQMSPWVHRVDKALALPDLPPKVEQDRRIKLTADERNVYYNMKKHLLVEVNDVIITAPQMLTKLMKLRQQTSGFIYDQTSEAHWYGNSKIRELEAVLEELGDQQVIIWCEFKEEIEKLKEVVKGSSVTMYSQTESKADSLEQFQSGKAQYLLAHPKSAAHGLTFNNCSAMVYFNNSWSFENNQQTQDRNHRIGQEAEFCLYIYLVVEDTIDTELIYPALRDKAGVSEDMLRRFLGR